MKNAVAKLMLVPVGDESAMVEIWREVDVEGALVALHWEPRVKDNPALVASCKHTGKPILSLVLDANRIKVTETSLALLDADHVVMLAKQQLQTHFSLNADRVDAVKNTFSKKPNYEHLLSTVKA